ncbi:MAG TPA: AraC family transcriptional regulator [Polyangiaceae bacterium]|nr:AraC family transcriptional regulator [Polyangiaceae bacterium]
MKRPRQQRTEPLQIHRLAAGTELILCDSDTVILVVRGACGIRGARSESKRLEAGALVVQQAASHAPLDRRIARALELLRADPAKAWTIEQLARAVGLSRAAFARRFVEVSGCTPARFLGDLRLALAASRLEDTDDSLAEVATRVGYLSEFAFSRAFKRRHGVAPGTFRRLRQSAPSSPIRLAA